MPNALDNTSGEDVGSLHGRPDVEAELRALMALKPLETRVADWRRRHGPSTFLEPASLMRNLAATAGRRLVLCLGHDDYRSVRGGVQFCIQREEQAVRAAGDNYLNIRPAQPLPRLAHLSDAEDPAVVLTLDGEEIGICAISTLLASIESLALSGRRMPVVIHHLLGHNPEQTAALITATRSEGCLFWLHDFFSICPSFTLQRNDRAFCDAPPIRSNACTLCLYGSERKSHAARMAAFFNSHPVTLLSPSQGTLDLWRKRAGLPVRAAHVVPHVTLTVPSVTAADGSIPHTIRVAFLGTPGTHKGWPLFARLAADERLSPQYRFAVFSSTRPKAMIRHVPVAVTAQNPDAMTQALQQNGIDLVLIWPSWPETFSLTTHEAICAGCFVVTNPGAGHVAAVVERTGHGTVLQSEADLVSFLLDGRAERLVATRRALAGAERTARLSDMAAPYLDAVTPSAPVQDGVAPIMVP